MPWSGSFCTFINVTAELSDWRNSTEYKSVLEFVKTPLWAISLGNNILIVDFFSGADDSTERHDDDSQGTK